MPTTGPAGVLQAPPLQVQEFEVQLLESVIEEQAGVLQTLPLQLQELLLQETALVKVLHGP